MHHLVAGMKPEEYFDFVLGRIGFAGGSYWALMDFKDGTRWFKIGFGFYWRKKEKVIK